MVSADLLHRCLLENGYRVSEWGTRSKAAHKDVPDVPGVYALYSGETLQYVGKASDLHVGLSQHSNDTAIPFGTFAWFRLPADQISNAEAVLVREYQPPYNIKNTSR